MGPATDYIFRCPPSTPKESMSVAAKQLLRDAVEHLPEDATVEDAMDRLYFLTKVARGLDAADRGDVLSHEEARRAALGEDGTVAPR